MVSQKGFPKTTDVGLPVWPSSKHMKVKIEVKKQEREREREGEREKGRKGERAKERERERARERAMSRRRWGPLLFAERDALCYFFAHE